MLATTLVHACYLYTCWLVLVHACYLRIPARLIDPSDDRASLVSKTLQRLRSHVLDGSSDSSRFRSPMASPKPTSLRSSQADSSLIIGDFPHGSSSTVRKEPSSPTKPTEHESLWTRHNSDSVLFMGGVTEFFLHSVSISTYAAHSHSRTRSYTDYIT